MAGNVWEWVEDCWHSDYTASPANGDAWTTSCGGSDRVHRGGEFGSVADSLRSSDRGGVAPSYQNGNLGARCCRSL
jgi:formylglycine-generating enzyme required for sulfatase activity